MCNRQTAAAGGSSGDHPSSEGASVWRSRRCTGGYFGVGSGSEEDGGICVQAGSVPEDHVEGNVTDPDSRVMKTGAGWQQGYNAQAAVAGGESSSCVKNFLQFPVGAETRPYGRVSARREIFGRFMPPPAMSRIPVRMREPRRSGHIDNAAPSATAHGSPPQVPRSDADRTPRSGRS